MEKYLNCKRHVCREVHADPEGWKGRQTETESQWPEYADSLELVSTPGYLTARWEDGHGGAGAMKALGERSKVEEGRTWCQRYLFDHVQRVQEMKQHHVHTLNAKGERVPLTHCRRVDNPNKCRGDFPRTHWLIEKGVVLCKGIMQRMGMSLGGKKNKLGSLHGPRNEENLNGSHPALCAILQTNSDVQVPYRFAITEETHKRSECTDTTCTAAKLSTVIDAFQAGQDAQVGYTCDYCNKRAARSCNEVKECIKGHKKLQSQVRQASSIYRQKTSDEIML